jgi:hypothetical protein
VFCSQCSQKRNLGVLSVWKMTREFVANFLDYDSKTLTTIRGLFIPGFLTNQYLANRRVSYLSPMRLFVFLMVVFFAILSYQGIDQFNFNNKNSVIQTDLINKPKNTDNHYNLLEKTYPKLRYKVLMQRVYHELMQQLDNDQKNIKKLKTKAQTQLDNAEKLKLTQQKIQETEQQIKQLKLSLAAYEKVKNGIKFDDEESMNVTLFFNSRYRFKLLDMESLTTEELIKKYKITHWLEKIFVRQLLKFNTDSKAFGQFIFKNLTWVVVLEVLWMSLIFKLFYFRTKRLYVEHFIFNLNIRSWLFVIAIVILLIPYPFNTWVNLLLVLSIIYYLFASLRNVYCQSFLMTSVKLIILSFIELFVLVFSLVLVVLISSIFF